MATALEIAKRKRSRALTGAGRPLRVWAASHDAAAAFVAEFGEVIGDVLRTASSPQIKLHPAASPELEFLGAPAFVVEVIDLGAFAPEMQRALEEDPDGAEIFEVLSEDGPIRCWFCPLRVSEDGEQESEGESPSPASLRPSDVNVPVEADALEKLVINGQEVEHRIFFVERPGGATAQWDPTSFLDEVHKACASFEQLFKGFTKFEAFSIVATQFTDLVDRIAPDLRRLPKSNAFLVEIHDFLGELMLKEFALHEMLEDTREKIDNNSILEALIGDDGLASIGETALMLERSRKRIERLLDFTKTQIESKGLFADLGLNQTMLLLTVVTVGFGVLTLLDKYQSDRTFGVDAMTAVQRMLAVTVILVVLMLVSFWNRLDAWFRSSKVLIEVTDKMLTKSLQSWVRIGAQRAAFDAAWWVSQEHLQRLHTQHAIQLQAFSWEEDDSDSAEREKKAAKRRVLELKVVDCLDGIEQSFGWLSIAALESMERSAETPTERLQQIQDASRYIMRWSSLVMEWERPLSPMQEVSYWLTVRTCTLEMREFAEHGQIGGAAEISGVGGYTPWGDAHGLAAQYVEAWLIPTSERAELARRLDHAAQILLQRHASHPVPRDGALDRLFRPDDLQESSEYGLRYATEHWMDAAFKAGLDVESLRDRWVKAELRESSEAGRA